MQAQPSDAEIIPFPLVADLLPIPPGDALDAVLDATVDCIVRFGLAKTSLSDIARELGVAPSTVYRKVGSVENAVLLVAAREGHRMLARMPEVVAGVEGPQVITAFLAEVIRSASAHPMARRILDEEAEWLGRVATRRLDAVIDESVRTVTPFLAAAMDAGSVRRQDAGALAHWIARIALACLVAPPPGDVREALDHLLLPVLEVR